MTSSNWILNLVIWALLAIGIFFGLKAQIRRAKEQQERDNEIVDESNHEPEQK